MTVPSMDPSNHFARLNNRITQLEQQLKALVSASGILDSATIYKGGLTIIDPATGARMKLGNGQVQMWSDFVDNPEGFGRIYCDPASGINYFRIYPPYSDGLSGDNAMTIQGSRPGLPGNMWLYTNGVLSLVTRDSDGVRQGAIAMSSAVVSIDAPLLPLYSLPTTGSAANLCLGYSGSDWTVMWVTSSDRYKTDIAPVEVDPTEVLELTGITWVHNDNMDASPEGDIRRNVGWHAEQIDSKPSLRQFVNYDEQGRPDSVEDSRMSVALLEVVKAQQAQIDALIKRLDALESP